LEEGVFSPASRIRSSTSPTGFFFFINYAYKNNYQALAAKYNNLITINEDECYIGQPYSGYALRKEKDTNDVIIIGLLIKIILIIILITSLLFSIEKQVVNSPRFFWKNEWKERCFL